MSLFGSLLGDFDDDPFIGGHMRQMNRMMNTMFSSPFGGLMGPGMGSELMPFGGQSLMPFGFMGPNMNNIFQGMDPMQMGNNPNCHSYSSSTVMTMTNGPDGRPQVYQASSSVRQGPGGVKETKKAVADSRSGIKKMAIGHHIGDRAHIVEREQNYHTGNHEERQDFINLDEDEAEDFNHEWTRKSRNFSSRQAAISYPGGSTSRRHRALPALPSSDSPENSTKKPLKRRHSESDEDEGSKSEHNLKISKASDAKGEDRQQQ